MLAGFVTDDGKVVEILDLNVVGEAAGAKVDEDDFGLCVEREGDGIPDVVTGYSLSPKADGLSDDSSQFNVTGA